MRRPISLFQTVYLNNQSWKKKYPGEIQSGTNNDDQISQNT